MKKNKKEFQRSAFTPFKLEIINKMPVLHIRPMHGRYLQAQSDIPNFVPIDNDNIKTIKMRM